MKLIKLQPLPKFLIKKIKKINKKLKKKIDIIAGESKVMKGKWN